MTDQEINEAVARKLGWEPVPVSNDNVYYGAWRQINGVLVIPKVPDYCHSIEVAMGIVGEHKEGFEIKFKNGVWCVWMSGLRSNEYADTAPMAICLAFLKLP